MRVKSLAPVPNYQLVAWLIDRRESYTIDSGYHEVFACIIDAIVSDKIRESYQHGELDDLIPLAKKAMRDAAERRRRETIKVARSKT